MVKSKTLLLSGLCGLLLGNAAQSADYGIISQDVTADACDERQVNDDKKTAENRAVDKAGLSAVKLAGFIQKLYPDLSASALDLISYQIIDEYMTDVNTAASQVVASNVKYDFWRYGNAENLMAKAIFDQAVSEGYNV
ncbi:MAG: hypothetical protein IKR92_04375, partial [Alphaproteobacteria bacterium]|nr:hypothetical protein [Alphaproteobacteria bacterium]